MHVWVWLEFPYYIYTCFYISKYNSRTVLKKINIIIKTLIETVVN